ncbi:hypothetical protein ACQ4M3_00580 [Leptolyngbya sp. AN03gr2]|uniref:hypothetical protein n=1 Tax=unclassified Leptolyngbya TaxID=2650499 RepID=UPI003D31A8FA
MNSDPARTDSHPFENIVLPTERLEILAAIASSLGAFDQNQEVLDSFRSIFGGSRIDDSAISSMSSCGCAIACGGCSCGCSSSNSTTQPLSFDSTSPSEWYSPKLF